MRTDERTTGGTQPATYLALNGGAPEEMAGEVVEETLACISVNGLELASFMCSPNDLDKLAIGFLYNEGIINGLGEIASLHLSDNHCADVWLRREVALPQRSITTAGCGGGVTFDDLSAAHPPLESAATASPGELSSLMRQMHLGARLYQRSRGIHTAALASRAEILLQVEDLGRHNCIDKLAGAALQAGVGTRDTILLASGRISSEMLNKARRLEIPIVCSRTSPTSLSVALAAAWQITIVGYLRQSRMRIYTCPERILTQ